MSLQEGRNGSVEVVETYLARYKRIRGSDDYIVYVGNVLKEPEKYGYRDYRFLYALHKHKRGYWITNAPTEATIFYKLMSTQRMSLFADLGHVKAERIVVLCDEKREDRCIRVELASMIKRYLSGGSDTAKEVYKLLMEELERYGIRVENKDGAVSAFTKSDGTIVRSRLIKPARIEYVYYVGKVAFVCIVRCGSKYVDVAGNVEETLAEVLLEVRG